jgi:hypothetical protein
VALASRKKILLKHYESKEPQLFQQFDGFFGTMMEEAAISDRDHYSVTSSPSWELIDASGFVRVLIPTCLSSAGRDVAVRLLRMIAGGIEHGDLTILNREEVPREGEADPSCEDAAESSYEDGAQTVYGEDIDQIG